MTARYSYVLCCLLAFGTAQVSFKVAKIIFGAMSVHQRILISHPVLTSALSEEHNRQSVPHSLISHASRLLFSSKRYSKLHTLNIWLANAFQGRCHTTGCKRPVGKPTRRWNKVEGEDPKKIPRVRNWKKRQCIDTCYTTVTEQLYSKARSGCLQEIKA